MVWFGEFVSPFHLELLKLTGETYLKMKKYDKALEAYDKGIKYLESLKDEDVEGRINALKEQIEEVNKKK